MSLWFGHCVIIQWKLSPAPLFFRSRLLLLTPQDLGVCALGLVCDSVSLIGGVSCPNQGLWRLTAHPRVTIGHLLQDLATVSTKKATMTLYALNAAGPGGPSQAVKNLSLAPREVCVSP